MNNHPSQQEIDQLPESIDRVKPLGEVAPTLCPKCFSQMELGDMDGSMVILCCACKGVLIQSGVFQELMIKRRKTFQGPDAIPKPIDLKQLKIRLNCPGCKQAMEVHQYYGPGNVVIDSCVRCNFIYLDYGEIAALERAPGLR